MNRNEIIEKIRERKEPWDIVVIGGGATGVGCALDAATRGFDVLLLEWADFGKGTSSRSTKLVHGGIRYLAQGDISLVRESLHERGLLFKNAPHVVRKLEFVVPCFSLWDKFFYGSGLKIYDLLSGSSSFGRSRVLSRKETLERLPNIEWEGLTGGILYYDGQFDDTRLLIDMAVTAVDKGAALLNYAWVTLLEKDKYGGLTTVEFHDLETAEVYALRSRCVINAAGAFCDDVRRMSDSSAKDIVTFSQGIHLVFNRKFLPTDSALMIPKTSDGRLLFCVPWHDHLLVGTTDTAVEKASFEPVALDDEIDFVLETAGKYLAQKPTRGDILSVFAGIRPLIKKASGKTSSLSRGHDLFVDNSGLVTITGGKWTTYRKMAEDAVNRAIEVGGLKKVKCTTDSLPIKAPPKTQGERLHPDLPYASEDVVYAVRDEMARQLEDVLARRTRALFLNAKAAVEIAPKTAELMAKELGKDRSWIDEQVTSFKGLAGSYLRH